MDLSFSELKDLVFNASMGSNLPAGVCEDLSFGVSFLESRSLPGCKELLISLNRSDVGNLTGFEIVGFQFAINHDDFVV